MHSLVIRIANDGGHVTIQFDGTNIEEEERPKQSTYHASWLWSNDSRRVVLPSGQRTSTPGKWRANGRPSIKDARIIYCDIIGQNRAHDNSTEPTSGSDMSGERLDVPGPTLEDCCHPLSIYGDYPAWVSTTIRNTASMNAMSLAKDGHGVRPYLQIVWSTPYDDIHESIYDINWLKRFQYDDASRLQHRRRTEVQPLNAIRRVGPPSGYSMPVSKSSLSSSSPVEEMLLPEHGADGLVHLNYHSIIGEEGSIRKEGLFQLLHSVFRDGAAIVSGTPMSHSSENPHVSQVCRRLETAEEDELPVSKVARAMSGGSLSHGSLYGNTFHVRVGERHSNNVAYTSSALCPHQDLAYYESPPGIQLLHCAAMGRGVSGGESTLIDAMAAAHRLREIRPESFDCLVRCPATFVKQRDGACMTYRRPHIVLAEDGGEGGGGEGTSRFDGEIVAVYWSPPFEGPVCLPPGQVDRYYEAYADFERMLNGDSDTANGTDNHDELSRYAHEFTWEHKLNPGEMLVFNNRRMLHGRCGFSAPDDASFDESQRHLVGCYTNIDDTLNSYRVLLREKRLATSILNVGNGTTIIP
mmetsp:Transcript_13206/g.32095  ORF Transcript_13206/g.32095 Transcript_13206/m.32095 type:complete len:581 (-) Transcript_13206:441-2183(-)